MWVPFVFLQATTAGKAVCLRRESKAGALLRAHFWREEPRGQARDEAAEDAESREDSRLPVRSLLERRRVGRPAHQKELMWVPFVFLQATKAGKQKRQPVGSAVMKVRDGVSGD